MCKGVSSESGNLASTANSTAAAPAWLLALLFRCCLPARRSSGPLHVVINLVEEDGRQAPAIGAPQVVQGVSPRGLEVPAVTRPRGIGGRGFARRGRGDQVSCGGHEEGARAVGGVGRMEEG